MPGTDTTTQRPGGLTILRPSLAPREAGPPAWLVSGSLCGLAYPILPYLHLEFLLWIGLVPMLRALRHEASFRRFAFDGWRCMFTLLMVGAWWMFVPGTRVGFLSIGLGGFFMSVPFLFLFALRRLWGWNAAVWALPFVWAACEWAWLQTEVGVGWLVLSLAQARLWPLVQYVDVTGAYGVSFWLVLFNVLVYFTVERWEAAGRPGWRPLVGRLALVAAVMLVPPLLYTAWVLPRHPVAGGEALDVLLVQPNISPWTKWDEATQAAVLHKTLGIARDGVDASVRQHGVPDLIVMPENAVSYDLQVHAAARALVYLAVSRWDTPLLTGTLAFPEVPEAARTRLMRAQNRSVAHYNAATLVTPEAARAVLASGDTTADYSGYVYKRRLVPFTERVPYAGLWPDLANLAINLGGVSLWDAGSAAQALALTDAAGRTHRLGVLICYEQFYPEAAADMVRAGAGALVVASNESWFGKTPGMYLIAVSARLRAIETRRALARSTNTGQTGFVDAWGRAYGVIPSWQEATARGTLPLHTGQTFYVRHPNVLPVASAGLVVLLLAVGVVSGRMRNGTTAP